MYLSASHEFLVFLIIFSLAHGTDQSTHTDLWVHSPFHIVGLIKCIKLFTLYFLLCSPSKQLVNCIIWLLWRKVDEILKWVVEGFEVENIIRFIGFD